MSLIKLRTLLLSNAFYLFILWITGIYVGIHLFLFPKQTAIEEKTKELYGTIKEIAIQENEVKLKIKVDHEYIIGYFENKHFSYHLNDFIQIKGTLEKPRNNTIMHLFNYRKYLSHNHTFYIMQIENLKLIAKNKNIFYKIKNAFLARMDKYKSKAYLKLFLLGSKEGLEQKVYKSFQNNGISHLFCVSGMHVSFLTAVLLFLLKKIGIKEKKRFFFTFLFLFFYLFLTNFSPSILRSVLFFTLMSINKIYYFCIKPIHLFLLTLCLCLFINPYFLFHIGFLFSFTITFYLILFSKYLNTNHKIKNLFLVSFVSFMASLPICLYNFFSINILSIVYNIFFVPFISCIFFPFTLLTFLFPFLESILLFLIDILENLSILIDQINIMKFSFYKPNLLVVLIYYFVISFVLYNWFHNKKKAFLLFLFLLFFHYNYNFFYKKYFMLMIDVGQGESILLHMGQKNILIDTGGMIQYNHPSSIAENTVNLLKSLGIRKLDYLMITHGDYDHIGEAINLVKRIPIQKVLFNSNAYNKNEKKVIQVLKEKKIAYAKFKENSKIVYKKAWISSINKEFEDENDGSLVLYVFINGYKILLTGDSSTTSESYYIENYSIKPDILKLGHHGSKTATSTRLLDHIHPKLALISCGVDNKFKHPHQEVLNRLKQYHIPYLSTHEVGSIKINFDQNFTIQTFPA